LPCDPKWKETSKSAVPKQLKTLGDHIRRRRVERGLLQLEVAQQIGVTKSTIWNWERNASSPRWRCWPKIVTFLGYDPLPPALCAAERLVRYRKLRGMSQKQMAWHLAIDPGTLSKWERGQRTPKGKFLLRLTVAIGLPVETGAETRNRKSRVGDP
jgi:transcriptional regulator with XRE-family HTH domain